MKTHNISQSEKLLIRRHILEPGEALPWHTDLCRRFLVVISGDELTIEFRDSQELTTHEVHPGLVGWDEPEARVHRGINTGKLIY